MTTEARLQYELVQWAQIEGYFCFHCPNGEKRDSITGNKLKAMGTRAGVPDLIFVLPNGAIAWVELKLKNGKLSKPQEKFRDKLLSLDHHYILVQVDSVEEAVNYLAPKLSNIYHPE